MGQERRWSMWRDNKRRLTNGIVKWFRDKIQENVPDVNEELYLQLRCAYGPLQNRKLIDNNRGWKRDQKSLPKQDGLTFAGKENGQGGGISFSPMALRIFRTFYCMTWNRIIFWQLFENHQKNLLYFNVLFEWSKGIYFDWTTCWERPKMFKVYFSSTLGFLLGFGICNTM